MRFHWLAQTATLLLALPTALGVILTNGTTSGVRHIVQLPNGATLQSSGFASLNECPAAYNMGSDCVYMRLNGTGQLDTKYEGDVDRQRIELRGPSSTEVNQSMHYNWNIRIGENTTNHGPTFFDLGKVISGEHVPQYVLGLKNDSVAFENRSDRRTSVNCTSPQGEADKIPVVDLRQTVSIDLAVVYGSQNGSVKWTLTNEDGKVLLKCMAFNTLVPVGTYVKTGIYRSMEKAPLEVAEAWVGNWSAQMAPTGAVRYEDEYSYSFSSNESVSVIASVHSSVTNGSTGDSIKTESSSETKMNSSVQVNESSKSTTTVDGAGSTGN